MMAEEMPAIMQRKSPIYKIGATPRKLNAIPVIAGISKAYFLKFFRSPILPTNGCRTEAP